MVDLGYASGGQGPLGEDSTSLYAAQIVGVGFHSFPADGAAPSDKRTDIQPFLICTTLVVRIFILFSTQKYNHRSIYKTNIGMIKLKLNRQYDTRKRISGKGVNPVNAKVWYFS